MCLSFFDSLETGKDSFILAYQEVTTLKAQKEASGMVRMTAMRLCLLLNFLHRGHKKESDGSTPP
jgi:hypothetical protein